MALLSYKDNENLKQVAEECRRKGAHVEEIDQDVADHDGMREVILRFDDDHPLDLVYVKVGGISAEFVQYLSLNCFYLCFLPYWF